MNSEQQICFLMYKKAPKSIWIKLFFFTFFKGNTKTKSNQRKKKQSDRESRAELNLIKMLIVMCGLFIFGNLPIAFSDIIKLFDQNVYNQFSFFNNLSIFLFHTTDLFVYYTFNSQFRDSFKKIFSCIVDKKFFKINFK
jgi:hypothetical protein